MSKLNVYRVYKEEVSSYTKKNGMILVKQYGCNGKEHRIQYVHLEMDRKTRRTTGGQNQVYPDKVLGPCDHESCKDLGFFILFDDDLSVHEQ